MKYKPIYLTHRETLEKYAKTMRENPTKGEIDVVRFLKRCKIKYKQQHIIADRYIVDFFLPTYNTIIEVDGSYHQTVEQRTKDANREYVLRSSGYNVVRLTNSEALKLYNTSYAVSVYNKIKNINKPKPKPKITNTVSIRIGRLQ